MDRRSALVIFALMMLVGASLSVWCVSSWPTANTQQQPIVPEPVAELPRPVGVGPRAQGSCPEYSNILPTDYMGPNACATCHETQFQRWSAHPHRAMNQLPSKETVKGDFAEHVWTVRPGQSVTFSTDGNDYLMTINSGGVRTARYRVTRTVGSRYMQMYMGVQTDGTEPPGSTRYTVEHRLPFAYWFRLKRWVPVNYIDAGDPYPANDTEPSFVPAFDPRQSLTVVFNLEHSHTPDREPVVPGVDAPDDFVPYTQCLHCHNTYPHAYRIFNPNKSGFPDAVFKADPVPLSRALGDKFLERLVAPTGEGLSILSSRVDPNRDLVTLGISCEACHHGGREHVKLQRPMSFFPTNPHVHVTAQSMDRPFTGKRGNPATSQGICAQCHCGQAATYPNLARTRNSAEVSELITSACSSQLRCVDCHDPHTGGVPSGGPTLPEHLAACVRCHPKYSTPKEAAAHSRHGVATGVNCLDCHMPRITRGVDGVVRTHHISLPVEKSMVEATAPNACNLCHLDKSVRWTLDEVKKGWGRDILPQTSNPRDIWNRPAGQLWLASDESHIRMVAVDAYSRSPLGKSNLSSVLGGLEDVALPNRPFALFAVERLLGRTLSVSEMDICAGPAQRKKQIELLRATIEKNR